MTGETNLYENLFMPNQRDPAKKLFSIAVDKKDLEKIEAAARQLGITRTEFIRLAAKKELERRADPGKNDPSPCANN